MDQGDLTIDHYLRSTWLNIQKMYNEQAARFNSTMVMGFTLLSIDPKEGTPSTLLGPRMGMEPTSLSRTLKRLEEQELITREPNPDDRRSVLITLTKEGLKMRDVSKEVVLKFYAAIDEMISPEELSRFYQTLHKINSIALDKEIFKMKKQLN